MLQVCRESSVAAVAAEDSIDHGADNGNTITGASTVAVAITGAAVVDRAVIIDLLAAVVAAATTVVAAAGSDDDTTATGVASRSISATGGASHRASAATTSGKGLSAAAAAMPGKGGLSAATMTTILMAGSQRIRCHWHATQRDRGRESDQSFFVKHVILLCFKQNYVCDCDGNAVSRAKVARDKDTFACQIATRFALIVRVWFSCHVW
jgi:hypothetical protein